MNDSDKHFSLLQYGINLKGKKIFNTLGLNYRTLYIRN